MFENKLSPCFQEKGPQSFLFDTNKSFADYYKVNFYRTDLIGPTLTVHSWKVSVKVFQQSVFTQNVCRNNIAGSTLTVHYWKASVIFVWYSGIFLKRFFCKSYHFLLKVSEVVSCLFWSSWKLVFHLPKKIICLNEKWWKILFISSWKLFIILKLFKFLTF